MSLNYKKTDASYRLAAMVSNPEWTHGFCDYARLVIKGTLLFITLVTFLSTVAIYNLIGIVAAFQGNWSFDEHPPFVVANVTTLAATVLIGLMVGWAEFTERRYAKKRATLYDENGDRIPDADIPRKQPSFLSAWWASVHDKICPTVTFID